MKRSYIKRTGKKKRKKRRKKNSWKALVNKLDKAFSIFIRKQTILDYGPECQLCAKRFKYIRDKKDFVFGEVEVNFHFRRRGLFSTRWSEICCVGACSRCNMSMERDEAPYIEWFKENRGADQWDQLTRESLELALHSNEMLESMINHFEMATEIL